MGGRGIVVSIEDLDIVSLDAVQVYDSETGKHLLKFEIEDFMSDTTLEYTRKRFESRPIAKEWVQVSCPNKGCDGRPQLILLDKYFCRCAVCDTSTKPSIFRSKAVQNWAEGIIDNSKGENKDER